MQQPLPPGWREVLDESGRAYFLNDNTGEARWDAPNAQAAHGHTPSQAGALLPGWRQVVNDYGEAYFFNDQTGESSWEAPLAQQNAYASGQSGRGAEGLDFANYREFMHQSGEGNLAEAELRRRFDDLSNYAGSHNSGRGAYDGAYTGGAFNYAPQRAARLNERRQRNPDRFQYPTALQEFLRWQEWYVQYCKLRNIGQHAHL